MQKKTELILLSKKHSRKKDEKYTITLDDKIIEEKANVKYLGVVLDQFPTFQDEIKKILRKLACEIKTLQSIKKSLPVKTRLLIMNALVISHLHYPAILLNGISANLMVSLEKQLSWAVKKLLRSCKIGLIFRLEAKTQYIASNNVSRL